MGATHRRQTCAAWRHPESVPWCSPGQRSHARLTGPATLTPLEFYRQLPNFVSANIFTLLLCEKYVHVQRKFCLALTPHTGKHVDLRRRFRVSDKMNRWVCATVCQPPCSVQQEATLAIHTNRGLVNQAAHLVQIEAEGWIGLCCIQALLFLLMASWCLANPMWTSP